VSEHVISGRDPQTGQWTQLRHSGGVIVGVEREPYREQGDGWLAAGLVDLQVNGYRGHDVKRATPETIVGLVHELFSVGVTTVAPTVTTASEHDIASSLRSIAEARKIDSLARRAIPFAHVEGPHLSEQEGARGAHAVEHIRPPSAAEFERWQAASGGLVGMVTLSPHYDESADYIRALTRQGVRVAIGHTHAAPEQITAAVDAGAVLSTHLGNGAPEMLARHPNYIWTQLAEDRLTASFIADGHHLPADALTAMLRAKGMSRSILVSDAEPLAGAPPGQYRSASGMAIDVATDGRLSVAGTPYLAGAGKSLLAGVATVAGLADFGLASALRLASENPGRFADGRGTLRVGGPADVIRLRQDDEGLAVLTTVIAGSEFHSES
jgi:N-acetylglucosamine-6-phosphate deacetylase